MANNIDKLVLQKLPVGGWVIAFNNGEHQNIFCGTWDEVLNALKEMGV